MVWTTYLVFYAEFEGDFRQSEPEFAGYVVSLTL